MFVVSVLAAGAAAFAQAPETHPAIARLNQGGYDRRHHCTATVVGSRTVLTAAHCAPGTRGDGVFVLPGYARGAWPEALEADEIRAETPPRDVATLCMKTASAAPEIPLARRGPQPGEDVVVIGYPVPRAHLQSRIACTVSVLEADGRFRMTCPLAPGASGAPVLREGADGAEVIGVVSARGLASSYAYSVAGDDAPPACEN